MANIENSQLKQAVILEGTLMAPSERLKGYTPIKGVDYYTDEEREEFLNEVIDSVTTGKQGKSAYEVAVDEGFEGTEEEWLESLRGEKGKDLTFDDLTDEQKAELKGEKGDKGDKGEDAISAVNPRGQWSEEETYNKGDYVTGPDGNAYTCMQDGTTGISPIDDSSVW